MRLSEAEKADRRMKARECMSDPTFPLPPFVEPVALMTSPTAKPAIAALVAAETYSAHEAVKQAVLWGYEVTDARGTAFRSFYRIPGCRHGHHDFVQR